MAGGEKGAFICINDKEYPLDTVNPYSSVGSFLNSVGLMGARRIDDEDVSGADAVLLVKYNKKESRFEYEAIPAYLVPLVALVGQQIITVEGIGSIEAMNPIQKRFYSCESFQCGYCAGGYVMSLYTLLRNNQKPTCADIEDALSGHFCRCTGYRSIAAAAFGYAVDAPKDSFYGDPNWKFEKAHEFDVEKEPKAPHQVKDNCETDFTFKNFISDRSKGIMMKAVEVPGSLNSLKTIMGEHPDTIIIAPGCERVMTGEHLTKDRSETHYTLVHRVQELGDIVLVNTSEGATDSNSNSVYEINVGLTASIQKFIDTVKDIKNEVLEQVVNILLTRPKEHRNYFSLNSLLSDPLFSTVLSVLRPKKSEKIDGCESLAPITYSVASEKSIAAGIRPVSESLAHGYIVTLVDHISKVVRTNMSLVVKCPNAELRKEEHEHSYLSADGDVMDVDTLIELFCSDVNDEQLKKYQGFLRHSIIQGVSASSEFKCPAYYKKLAKWTRENNTPLTTTRSFPLVSDSLELVEKPTKNEECWEGAVGEIPPPDEKLHTKYVHKGVRQQHGAAIVTGQLKYPSDKHRLYTNVLYAFPVLTSVPCGTIIDVDLTEASKVPGYFNYYCAKDLPEDSPNTFSGIPPNDTPVFVNKNGRVLHCDQIIGIVVATSNEVAMRCARLVKVTYDTDMHSERNEAFRRKPEVQRKRLDFAGMDNTSVENCFTIKQAMEVNSYHPNSGVGEKVVTLGLNPISSPENRSNPNVVRDPSYDAHEPNRDTDAPLDPEESKKAIQKIISECEVKIEGEMSVGGQEHFYAEPFTATVVPTSHDTYLVHVSSQNLSKIQTDIARNMCIPSSKIIVQAESIGGGFGGKQDRPQIVAIPCAVASILSKRPVTITLTRDVDMRITGGRHAYLYKYSAGFSKDGKFQALDALLVSDGGGTYDVTSAVLDKSIFQHTSVYTVPKVRVEGRAARTNHPTNTAYRGFGAPQTTEFLESVLDHAAQVLKMDPNEIRRLNLNKPGDRLLTGTYTGTTKGCDIPQRLFDRVEEMSNYENRKKEIEEFNSKPENKFIKRGLAIVPLKNSVCFEEDFMNQAHSLVHIYTDGTVRVVHSGIEMGQGLSTKMRMVAAETLRVDISRVYVGPTGTNTCANTQPTAASSGTDMNAPAVRFACEAIRKRLEEVRNSMGSKDEGLREDGTPDPKAPIESFWGKAGFNGVVTSAYFGRVGLSEHHYFILPHLQWNWGTKLGYTGFYTAYGICCSEVELNAVTGEYRLIRCDLVEDVGNTLNPALDCGQVEGGFTQGLGWITTEELCYDTEGPNATGRLLNSSLSEYHPPMMKTVPNEMHVSLIDGTGDPMSAYGAKASAEAPLCLSPGVHFAIRDAVRAFRKSEGKEGLVCITAPTTSLKVREYLE